MEGPWGQILRIYWIQDAKREIISERWLESADAPEGSEDCQLVEISEEMKRL